MTRLLTRRLGDLCTGAILAILLLTAQIDGGHAQTDNQAVLVLDHSGSMWAQIEGTSKIVILRDSVKAMFDEYQGKIDLGVIAHGAQKSQACDSIDTVKAIGAIDPKSDSQELEKVNPAGSAAIAGSLNAAGELFDKNGIRNIIMISDSTDDCNADPCAIATSLKQRNRTLIAHVIAFSEQDLEPLRALSCISGSTGGTFQTASNATELNTALRNAFEATQRPPQPNQIFGSENSLIPEVLLSDDPGTIVLSAVLSSGASPLSSGVIWRVYSIEIEADGSYKQLHKLNDAQTAITLPPGEYLVNAAYGQANVTKRITVWPGKRTEDTFNLQAGGLRLYATLANQPLLADNALTFNVFSEESDQFGNRRRVIANARSGVVLRLNGGTYRIVSKYGDANSVMEVDVTVESGKLTEATIDHQAGKVTFRLVERQGGEALADTIWHIYSSDGELVRKSGGAFPTHVLAAGEYSVRVEHGGREFAARFAIGVGDRQQVEVIKPQ
ncbi:MAG: hypothetical protein KTR19_00620 [Hyphomicrobiales bacterium]|nr:hypothetical protein [Hyphomicrobiales bacterium]